MGRPGPLEPHGDTTLVHDDEEPPGRRLVPADFGQVPTGGRLARSESPSAARSRAADTGGGTSRSSAPRSSATVTSPSAGTNTVWSGVTGSRGGTATPLIVALHPGRESETKPELDGSVAAQRRVLSVDGEVLIERHQRTAAVGQRQLVHERTRRPGEHADQVDHDLHRRVGDHADLAVVGDRSHDQVRRLREVVVERRGRRRRRLTRIHAGERSRGRPAPPRRSGPRRPCRRADRPTAPRSNSCGTPASKRTPATVGSRVSTTRSSGSGVNTRSGLVGDDGAMYPVTSRRKWVVGVAGHADLARPRRRRRCRSRRSPMRLVSLRP